MNIFQQKIRSVFAMSIFIPIIIYIYKLRFKYTWDFKLAILNRTDFSRIKPGLTFYYQRFKPLGGSKIN